MSQVIVCNKLVRDKIPELIEKSGARAQIRYLDKKEIRSALTTKLREEIEELACAPEHAILEEAADVYEVLLAFLSCLDHVDKDVIDAAKKKRSEKGSFSKSIWLESVEDYKCSL